MPDFSSATSSVQGSVDGVYHRTVFGWAYDSTCRDRTIAVDVWINGVSAGVSLACKFRSDLLKAGIGNGHHAFEFVVPEGIADVNEVEVYVQDTLTRLAPSRADLIDQKTSRSLPMEWKARDGRYWFPSFFILGAAKSGTTSLHYYLSQCPGILMSTPKEPFFFEAEYPRGTMYYFNKYFSKWNGEELVGEARHRNLYLPYVPPRIHEYNPNARLIVILRNPVERAVSHWWFYASRGLEERPLKEALLADLKRIEECEDRLDQQWIEQYAAKLEKDFQRTERTYLESGYYYDQIQRYLDLFGKDQLHVILFDDFVRDPARATGDVLQFLGGDRAYADNLVYTVRNPSVSGMLQQLDSETISWLAEHYRPQNARLSALLQRPLSEWDQAFRGARIAR